ncbi:MAG: hypothetical protein FJ088_15870, partial [Deltaproteobacteria bacterium]|nr:hypothetical protein [Deltaproteobacteria bacterium]
MIKIFGRFQLEASKLERSIVFQVTVYERLDRQKGKLFAETQCSDPLQFILQFIIREAEDFDSLLQKFLKQLDHRGFSPVRYRKRAGNKWEEWIPLNSKENKQK